MRKNFVVYFTLLLLSIVVLISCTVATVISTEISSLKQDVFTTKYGNLKTKVSGKALFAAGFDWGDLVKVSILNQELNLPIVPSYAYVDTGAPAIIVEKKANSRPKGNVCLAINMGDFTTTYGIATKTTNEDKTFFWTANEGVSLPITVTFELAEKAGYLSEYLIRDLVRTNERSDYSKLSDEQFANFRKVEVAGVKNLYRTSSPVDSELGRNIYADKALKDAKVSVILNLSDSKEDVQSRPEFKNSYYSTCKVLYLNLGVDFSSEDFRKGLAQGLRFMAENKGVYAIHCKEGKDRTGFVCALLECLMGSTAQEVEDDYMTSYYNYYNVDKNSEKYDGILSSNIVQTIQNAFNVDDFWTANLQDCAENYLKEIGLSNAEIDALKANLK